MANVIHIEVVSDFACPWCLIGHRRLRNAIDQRPNLNIEVIWRSFQLNPDMPQNGINRRDYYRRKFGEEGAKRLRESLNIADAQDGIVFCDKPEAMAPNTLLAHVLMYWASEDENVDADAVAEKLFLSHHVECENIGDVDVLVAIAGEVGMDQGAVRSKLEAGVEEDEVKDQIRQSVARGVSSVPHYVINGKLNISGAQPPATLVSAFDQIEKLESDT